METKFTVREGEKFTTFRTYYDDNITKVYIDENYNTLSFKKGRITNLVTRNRKAHHFKSNGSCFSLMKVYNIKSPNLIVVSKIDPNNKIEYNDGEARANLYLHNDMLIGEKYDFEISDGKVTRVYEGNTCYDLVNNYSTNLEKFFYLEKNGKRLVSMKEEADIITLVENDEHQSKKLGNDKMIITNNKNSSKFDLNEDRFISLLDNESYTWLGNKRYISVDNKVKRIETYSDDLLIHIEFLN